MYVLSSFTQRHTSGILKSFVTYLNISESSILLQTNSHCDYTRILRDAGANFAEVLLSHQAQLAYCSRALESSNWFPLLTHIYSHQSDTPSLMVTYVINM